MRPVKELFAQVFATWAHRGQLRKYTGEAYIVHPKRVANIVRSVPHTTNMLCAAWLHDVVEDTKVSLFWIRFFFGKEVAVYVEMLTDVSKPSDGKRTVRKAIDRDHTSMALPCVKTIKLADLIENSESIIAHDPNFAKVYLVEKELLLDVLTEGDPTLWDLANEQVKRWGTLKYLKRMYS